MAATSRTVAVLQPLPRSRTGLIGSPRDGSSQGHQAAPAPEAEQAGLAQSMPRISAGNCRATPHGNSGGYSTALGGRMDGYCRQVLVLMRSTAACKVALTDAR